MFSPKPLWRVYEVSIGVIRRLSCYHCFSMPAGILSHGWPVCYVYIRLHLRVPVLDGSCGACDFSR